MNRNNYIEFDTSMIKLRASKSWFKTREILNMLKSIGCSNLQKLLVNKLPNKPQSGEIFFLQPDQADKTWKYDGHNYLRRKSGKGVHELAEIRKVDGQKVYSIN